MTWLLDPSSDPSYALHWNAFRPGDHCGWDRPVPPRGVRRPLRRLHRGRNRHFCHQRHAGARRCAEMLPGELAAMLHTECVYTNVFPLSFYLLSSLPRRTWPTRRSRRDTLETTCRSSSSSLTSGTKCASSEAVQFILDTVQYVFCTVLAKRSHIAVHEGGREGGIRDGGASQKSSHRRIFRPQYMIPCVYNNYISVIWCP